LGEVNCPTVVKLKKLGINLILGGHRELELYEVKNSRLVVGLK
jgi:putative NIF3 family GTP cyclohydrolase 1 type 2